MLTITMPTNAVLYNSSSGEVLVPVSAAALNSVKDNFAFKGKHAFFVCPLTETLDIKFCIVYYDVMFQNWLESVQRGRLPTYVV